LSAAEIRCPLGLIGCYLDEAITLTDASVRSITLTGTHLLGILANDLTVDGHVFLDKGFKAKGVVTLQDANIDGELRCGGGTFENGLDADGLRASSVFLDEGFNAKGDVNLGSANIDGLLGCRGGTFENGLKAAVLKASEVFLNKGFKAKGDVSLVGADISSELNCSRGSFVGDLDLRKAHIGALADDPGSWPKPGELFLDGFEYAFSTDSGTPRDVKRRLNWIELGPKGLFLAQPYEQLAKVLHAMGDEAGAHKVSIRKKWMLRKRDKIGFPAWLGNWFLYLTIGYGYRAWLPLVWAVVIVWVGAILFRSAVVLRAADPNVPEVASASGQTPPLAQSMKSELPYPVFYSIDVFLPFADLHQKKTWLLDEKNRYFPWYEVWYLFEELADWVLTALLAAAATGLLKNK
jgi:hypothetical protein